MTIPLTTEHIKELRLTLSNGASVITPNDVSWEESTTRWTVHQPPNFSLVVIPAVEQDIQTAISFARSRDLPFLVTTATHGNFAAFQKIKNGVQIDLQKFAKVEVSKDGKYALVGGGVINKDVVSTLREVGKVTVTGVCEMVGAGFWLGGGHGILQGRLGLAADQIIEARVILGDGRIVTTSETSEPDLFWALRGAGYMFCIVTEMKIKIYDLEPYATWTYEMFMFSEELLEQVFTALKHMRVQQEPTDQYYARFSCEPALDPEKAVVAIFALSSGTRETTHLTQYTKLLHDIPNLAYKTDQVPYQDIPKYFACDEHGPVSIKGYTFMLHAIDLIDYNVASVREAYRVWNQTMRDTPAFVHGASSMVFETYPCHAVQAVPAESTAFPWRADHMLITPFTRYDPDASLDPVAEELGHAIRRILHRGSGRAELHTYVNYANGSESIQSMYGYEPWRLEKLRAVKAKYDPDNVFCFHGELGR